MYRNSAARRASYRPERKGYRLSDHPAEQAVYALGGGCVTQVRFQSRLVKRATGELQLRCFGVLNLEVLGRPLFKAPTKISTLGRESGAQPNQPSRLMHMHRAMLPSRATCFLRTAILLGVAACWRCTRSAKCVSAEACAEENESHKQGEDRALHFMPPSGKAATKPTRRYQAAFVLGREKCWNFQARRLLAGCRFRKLAGFILDNA